MEAPCRRIHRNIPCNATKFKHIIRKENVTIIKSRRVSSCILFIFFVLQYTQTNTIKCAIYFEFWLSLLSLLLLYRMFHFDSICVHKMNIIIYKYMLAYFIYTLYITSYRYTAYSIESGKFAATNSERNQQINTRHFCILYILYIIKYVVEYVDVECVHDAQRNWFDSFWKNVLMSITFYLLLYFSSFFFPIFGFHFAFLFVLLSWRRNENENENVEKLWKQLVGDCYFAFGTEENK